MRATEEILGVWKRFDDVPMETLTKAWLHARGEQFELRSVERMREQREEFGTSGNCFDLAYWLMDELRADGIECYPVGSGFGSASAHAAVIAVGSDGKRYLCDLGDQWVQPVLVDLDGEDYTEDLLKGFVAGMGISVKSDGRQAQIRFRRAGGREHRKTFNLRPADEAEFAEAAAYSQRLLRFALAERRFRLDGHTVCWEYDRGRSHVNTDCGLYYESAPLGDETWSQRISRRTGLAEAVVRTALDVYGELDGGR
ncbi:hypothetical protein QWJ34_15510 [Saccharibacillus sp. CPCC 101409]|uniref:hypothetical protein n=1 Tax=Saccharibacillus sp. CPCC 101409 TaxID=3058041 RepID=UPI002671B9F3|nr:hypothetical protein [Saccharibacillus sp. CPCC 101409]MDO3411172.1 hypothetical protein [Saccharibacillus sp. CPCC 101409]